MSSIVQLSYFVIYLHRQFLAKLPNRLIGYKILSCVCTHEVDLILSFHNHKSPIVHFSYFNVLLPLFNEFLAWHLNHPLIECVYDNKMGLNPQFL